MINVAGNAVLIFGFSMGDRRRRMGNRLFTGSGRFDYGLAFEGQEEL